MKFFLFSLEKNHQPGHHDHNCSTDGSSQVGIDPCNSDLSKNGSKTGKYCGKHGIDQPFLTVFFLCVSGSFFSCDHQHGTCTDQHYGNDLDRRQTFMQKDQRKKDRQDRTGLVNGNNLVDIPFLQGMKIT